MRFGNSSRLLIAVISAGVCLSVGCLPGSGSGESESSTSSAEHALGLRDQASISVPFKKGFRGYNCFRTPAMVKANDGAILAFAGGRKGGCGDDTDGDLVLRRSTNGGKDWEQLQVLDQGWKDPKNRVGLANPVVLENGRILVLYLWSRFTSNEDDRGCRRVFMMSSDDNGKSWSKRRDITKQAQRKCREDSRGRFIDPPAKGEWGWTGLGPVHGIVKKFAPHKGRIIIAARHLAENSKTYSHVIYSDDNGENWTIGGSLNLISTESTVVELPNGQIMLNSRSRDSVNARTAGISKDGGKTFKSAYIDTQLTEPGGVQGSLLRFGDKILFSNPMSTTARTSGSIRVSSDNGRSWRLYATYSSEGQFSGYSDMVRVDGNIGVLYEWGPTTDKKDAHKEIRFVKISADGLR